MNVPELESEVRRVMKRYLDATRDFRERIAAAEPHLAAEWEHHVREVLGPLEKLALLLVKVYSLPPEEGAAARKELVDYAAGDFGAQWHQHLTRLEALVEARYPKPQDPEDSEPPPTVPWTRLPGAD